MAKADINHTFDSIFVTHKLAAFILFITDLITFHKQSLTITSFVSLEKI